MSKKQQQCPYCHTDTCYTGSAGEREEKVPQKYLYNYESQDSLFNAAIYVLSGELCLRMTWLKIVTKWIMKIQHFVIRTKNGEISYYRMLI